jgi:NADH-quinone oxidoreductase subunit C
MNESKFINELKSQFNGEQVEFRGDTSLFLRLEDLVPAVESIKKMGFERLSDITAVDYFPAENPRFHLVYEFTSVKNVATLEIRVRVPGINPSMPTIEKLYPNANWREREIFDMFGITFEGHSDMRRILMPHDWEGHPLRKDYPLGYEEPQFSFNFDEIDVRKPYAKKDQP